MVDQALTARSIFEGALELASDAERSSFLDDACAAQPDLRQQVNALLCAHAAAGSFLEAPLIEGLCGTSFAPRLAEQPGTLIGPYKLLQQIGEGGMGVVFMAEQTEPLRRTVALKIIKPGMDTRQVIARFEAERQALAMMDHPNIAKVLDAGSTESGRPYFVMELVKGVPITRYCDDKHLSLRERLELFLPVCHAVQHAHQKGIIHRDIKPTNVLVAEYDNERIPKVIDFGVAKATAQRLTERTMFTEFGQVLGTMEYMSPEQAKLNQLDVDTRSDIYSLGALLYELLAGSTPFGSKRLQEAAFDEILRIIREEEPPKPSTRLSSSDQLASISASRGSEPRKLSGLVAGELDWVVMKALEKDRNRRFETASAFAADIRRYLDDERVLACPPSWSYRFRKFARRNKGGFITTAAGIAGVLATILLLAFSNVRIRAEKLRKDGALREKAVALGQAQQQANAARAARRVAEHQRDSALENLYFAHMRVAHQDWETGQLQRMHDLLRMHVPDNAGPDRRGWEWYYLLSLAHRDERTLAGHTDEVQSVSFSPDGERLASSSNDRTVRVWDRKTGKEISILHGHETVVEGLAWSPDGEQLASGSSDGRVIVWAPETGAKVSTATFGRAVLEIAWSPDGSSIAAAGIGTAQNDSEDGFVWIWNPRSQEKPKPLIGKVGMVHSMDWSPDGRYLAAGENWQGRIQIWNASTSELVHTIQAHGHYIEAIDWSPDGRQFASASLDRSIKFWELGTWKNLRVIKEAHRGIIHSLSWSGDGTQLASAGEDGLIKIWNAITGEEATVLRGHEASVSAIDWNAKNGRLVSGGADNAVKLWDLKIEPTFRTIAGYECVAWSPNGQLLAARELDREGQQPTIAIIDAASSQKLYALPLPDSKAEGKFFVGAISWSPDGQKVAAALARPGKVIVWNIATRQEILSEATHGLQARSVAWKPDGRELATAGMDGVVHLWDIETRQQKLTYDDHKTPLGSVAWSPDGLTIASRSWDAVVRIWDPKTGHTFRELRHGNPTDATGPNALGWNPQGDRLAVGGYEAGEIIVWNPNNGSQLLHIQGHTSLVRNLAWSPDGKRLASGGHDRYLKIWDATTGRELLSLSGHESRIGPIVWSPDGRRLATSDHTDVKIWDGAIGYQLSREWQSSNAKPRAAMAARLGE